MLSASSANAGSSVARGASKLLPPCCAAGADTSLPADGEDRDARNEVRDAGRRGVVGREGSFVVGTLLGAATGVAETTIGTGMESGMGDLVQSKDNGGSVVVDERICALAKVARRREPCADLWWGSSTRRRSVITFHRQSIHTCLVQSLL